MKIAALKWTVAIAALVATLTWLTVAMDDSPDAILIERANSLR